MKSIRTKIILLSCIICIFSILSATMISYKILSDNIKEQTYQKFEVIAQKHAAEINGWFSVQERLLNELYDEIIYKSDYNQESLIEYFNYKNTKNSDIIEYYIAYPENYFVTGFGVWKPEGDYKVIEKEWYLNAINSDDVEISSPYVDANHGQVIVTLSKAIKKGDEVVGVICSDIAINYIVSIINDSDSFKYGYSFLVDNNNNILAHPNRDFMFSNEKGLIKVEQAYSYLIKNQLKNDSLTRITDYDGVEKFLVYTNLGFTGWDIGLIVSVKEVMKPLNNIVNSSIALTFILILISSTITFIFGNTISKPIKAAKDYIEHMSQLDITQSIDEKYLNSKDEIGVMFLSFQMIINSLKEFLMELKTISNKVSAFSDELASLSCKSSLDADKMVELSSNITELYDVKSKRIEKLYVSIENLHDMLNKFKFDRNILGEEITNQSSLIIDEAEDLINSINQLQRLQDFESLQLKSTYAMIEKQKIIMEEISSASQCLAELGEELNMYISKFKS